MDSQASPKSRLTLTDGVGEFATLNEAGAATRRTRAGIYDLARRGKIELVKLGGRTLVRRSELDRFIATAAPWTSKSR